MRILGIDPGIRITGYGVLELRGGVLRHVDCGIITPPVDAPLAQRLLAIVAGLDRVVDELAPNVAAVENVFIHKSPRAALTLGHARGAAMVAVVRRGLEVYEYSPAEIKQMTVGYGRAEKSQVQEMTRALLRLPEVAQSDAADAIAVALCHVLRGPPRGGAR